MTEETFSISEILFSIRSVFFSSSQAILRIIALRPKAIGCSSKEMFCAPCSSIRVFVFSLIFSKSTSTELGMIFAITAATPAMICFGERGL